MTPKDWKLSGTTMSIGGHDLFVRTSGRTHDPAILFLHGFPTSGWDWHRITPGLEGSYFCIVPDFLGFGFSSKPRGHAYSIAEQADLMEAVVAAAGVRHYHILAHDYGDTVAQELLARDKERPDDKRQILSACLLNGGLFPETHRPRLMQKLLASPLGPFISARITKGRFAASFGEIFGSGTKPSDQEIEDYWQCLTHGGGKAVFHRLIGYMAERRAHRDRWVAALVDASCPLALINGSADPISGAHMVARYCELVSREDKICQLAEIGHYPQMEAPNEVLQAYQAFLSDRLALP